MARLELDAASKAFYEALGSPDVNADPAQDALLSATNSKRKLRSHQPALSSKKARKSKTSTVASQLISEDESEDEPADIAAADAIGDGAELPASDGGAALDDDLGEGGNEDVDDDDDDLDGAAEEALAPVDRLAGALDPVGSDLLDGDDDDDNPDTSDQEGPDDDAESTDEDSVAAFEDSSEEESIPSDLEGLPLASVVPDEDDGAAETKPSTSRKAQKGRAAPITQEGVQASKLGVAFERVLAKSGKQGVMEASKSLQHRMREEAENAAAAKEARIHRRELRRRGHVEVLPKGRDPEADARERSFVRIATKGVVQLFNAVTQAQKAQLQALEVGASEKSAIKETKAALLRVLKPDHKPGDKPAMGASQPGWKVLQEGYTGLESGSKMKHFDQKAAGDPGDVAEELADQEVSDDDFADW